MAEIKSVLLAYTNKNRVLYQKCAEFFRFIGLYVGEKVRKKQNLEIDKDESIQFDIELDIDNNNFEGIISKFKNAYDNPNTVKNIGTILEIYNKHKILQASMTLQYFCINHPVVKKAGKLFENAANELEKYYNNNCEQTEKNYFIRYAKLYCKQKANLAKFLTKDYLYYSVDELIEENLALQKDFPEYSNIWVLMGLICEISKEHKMECIEALKKARDAVGNKPYAVNILYRLGKNSEGIEIFRDLKYSSYENAYNIMPTYRNIYKIAQQYMKLEIWDLAIKYFKECLEKIKDDRKEYLDPLEQEYCFKVKAHLSFLYTQKEEYSQAIRYANEALDLKEEIYEQLDEHKISGCNRIYYEIYTEEREGKRYVLAEGLDPEELIELELNRMASKALYERLAISYQRLGMDDVADIFWSVVKQ